MRQLIIIPALLLLCGLSLWGQTYSQENSVAQYRTKTTDSTLTQQYTGHFGWSIMLPADTIAKFNKIGSLVNESGQTEVVNFMLRNGRGGIDIKYYTEKRMVPVGYGLLDSTMHFYEADSLGRNGHIYRRTYVLGDQAIEIIIMLTQKGQADLLSRVPAIFDSFMPPKQATFALEKWRYGRDKNDYERGHTPAEIAK